MSDQLSFTRRSLVRLAALAGTLSLAGLAGPAAAHAQADAKPFKNGINASTYVGGDGSYARYAQNGLKIGLIESYPVNFTDDSGKRTGWNTDMVVAALDRAGIPKYEFIEGPWETMVPGLQSSRFDLLASDVHVTPERVKIIDFTTPVFWYGDALAVQQGNPLNLHSWDGLAGHVVGTGLGTNWAEYLQQRTDLADLKLYGETNAGPDDLVAGRVDAMIVDDIQFTAFLNKNPLPLELVSDYVPHADLSDWTRFGVRKDDRDFNNVLSHAFNEMHIDGTILKILQSYGLGQRNLFVIPGMTGSQAS